jgi:hypothetical protein
VQQYTTTTPDYIGIMSNTTQLMKYDTQLTPTEITNKGLTEAVFLCDIKASGEFSIKISGVGTVYWGDGTSDVYSGTEQTLTHTFVKVGHIVSFVGTLTYWYSTTGGVNYNFNIASLPSGFILFRNPKNLSVI